MKQIIRRVAALVVGLGLGAAALAGLESVTHISDLNASWPLGSDLASTSDDHIRNIKTALKTDFPNVNGAVNPTPAQFNQLTSNTFTTAITENVASSTLTLNSTTATNASAILLSLGGTNKARFGVEGTAGGTITGSGVNDAFAFTTGGAFRVSTDSGATSAAAFANSGSTIQGASGGLTVNSSTSTNAANLFLNLGGTNKARLGVEGTSGSTVTGSSAGDLYAYIASGSFLVSNGGATPAFKVGSSGNVTISTPGSGVPLSVSGQPMFNAQRVTSTLSLANSAVTDLLFNSVNTQNGGTNYATGTGIFTAPAAGVYSFSVEVETTTSGGLTNSINAIYFSKNNTTSVGASRYDIPLGQVPSSQGTGITWRWGGSVTLSLAASDTVRVKFDNGAGTGGTIVMNTGSFFSGYMLY